jgi:hypothetical protein
MTPPEGNFVPDDPSLYGPDPTTERRNRRPLQEIVGLTAKQMVVIVAIATLVFVFLGGPMWSAQRETFPLRLFTSYLVIPAMVLVGLWWNHRLSTEKLIVASLVGAAGKFLLTAILDVLQGLSRHWPP